MMTTSGRSAGHPAKVSLAVYVPANDHLRTTIRAGSGIVGTPEGSRITLDYEGAIYGQTSLARFADRVAQAAGRHVTHYPTVARLAARPGDVRRIGDWDCLEGEVRLTGDGAAYLAAWLGVPIVAPDELLAGGARYEKRRAIRAALSSGDPLAVANARAYAAREHIDDLA